MAEGWLRHHALRWQLDLDVHSAGTEATLVKAEAIRVMAELDIDISTHTSKALIDLADPLRFDIVLTVCDAANEACPAYPARTRRLHASFPDPSGHDIQTWRDVRDAIGEACDQVVEALTLGREPVITAGKLDSAAQDRDP